MGRASHTIMKYPSSRQFTMDVGVLGLRKHHIKALIEVDITGSRERLKKYRNGSPVKVSLSSWLLKCIAQAISEHKAVHGIRMGKNSIIMFDEVDISMMVEKDVQGAKVPLPVLIRNANGKSMEDIHLEIQSAKTQAVQDEGNYVLGPKRNRLMMDLFAALPQPIRLMGWRFILRRPYVMKAMMGTVVVSSLGMAGRVRGWVIPVSLNPITITLGSIVKMPGVHRDEISIREYLPMTILIDHDVIDGAPAARFVARLVELVEGGFCLHGDTTW